MSANSELRMSGENARIIIKNCHGLLRGKYRGIQLWAMVADITGHGSGNSQEICRSANLSPYQNASAKILRDLQPTPSPEEAR